MQEYINMTHIRQRLAAPVVLFALASLFMGLYGGIYDPSFNNYLAQVHHMGEVARGGLEFPRELPGFLVVFVLALLMFLPDTRIASLSALLVGAALLGQGYLTPNFTAVVVWMLVWSTGAHLYMALSSSIGLRLASEGQEGRMLGKLGFLESLGTLLGMVIVYLAASSLHFSFGLLFGIAGGCSLLAALALYFIKPRPLVKAPRRLIFKRKYALFYWLNILFGARKQIYLTFAPWVLIKIFHTSVATFAVMGFIGTVINLLFRPMLGGQSTPGGKRQL
jgi:hypothetical protein